MTNLWTFLPVGSRFFLPFGFTEMKRFFSVHRKNVTRNMLRPFFVLSKSYISVCVCVCSPTLRISAADSPPP